MITKANLLTLITLPNTKKPPDKKYQKAFLYKSGFKPPIKYSPFYQNLNLKLYPTMLSSLHNL